MLTTSRVIGVSGSDPPGTHETVPAIDAAVRPVCCSTYPRPRRSSNTSNAERIKPLVRELGDVWLADVSRPMARSWALKHRWALPAARAMFADAMNDGLVDVNPFAGLRLPGSEGRKRIVALTEAELCFRLTPEGRKCLAHDDGRGSDQR